MTHDSITSWANRSSPDSLDGSSDLSVTETYLVDGFIDLCISRFCFQVSMDNIGNLDDVQSKLCK